MMMSVAGTVSPESRQREASRRDACQTAASMEHVKAVRRLFQREEVAALRVSAVALLRLFVRNPASGNRIRGRILFFLWRWLP